METEKEKSILNNASIKKNPITTVLGLIIALVATVMLLGLFVLPMFVTLKQQAPYDWYHVLAVYCASLLFVFFNDYYFGQLFGIGSKVLAKKTGAEEEKK